MKKVLFISMLILISNFSYAKSSGKTGEEVNPFENHDKNIARYEELLKKTKNHAKRKKYQKKLELWKKFKVELLAKKVTPLNKEVTRLQGQMERIEETKKKTLTAIKEKLETYNSYFPKLKDNPEKTEKLKFAIEQTKKKLVDAEKHYNTSTEKVQDEMDKHQQMVDQYYQWAKLSPNDVQKYNKNKNKLGSFKLN